MAAHRRQIAAHYLQTYFFIDLISLLPFGAWGADHGWTGWQLPVCAA